MQTYVYLVIIISIIGWTKGNSPLRVISPSTEYGYSIYRNGEKMLVKDFKKLVHIIRLGDYYEILKTMEENLIELGQTKDINSKFITMQIKVARDKLDLLTKTHGMGREVERQKRGLINIIGAASKFMFGTMDDKDAKEIYGHMENLERNIDQVVKQSNEQLEINDKLISGLKNATDHVRTSQDRIAEKINNIMMETNAALTSSHLLAVMMNIYADAHLINEHLDKITDTILMSRQNIVPHDLLDKETKDKYNITIEMFPYMRLESLSTSRSLAIILAIPRLSSTRYFDAWVIPMSDPSGVEIDYPVTEVIIGPNNVFEYEKDLVREIKLRECKNICLKNMLNKTNQCAMRLSHGEDIEFLKEGVFFTKNLKRVKLIQNCLNEDIWIEGNNIVEFSNCTIKIGEFEVTSNVVINFEDRLVVPQHVNFTKTQGKLILGNLELENIRNRQHIEKIEFQHAVTQVGVSAAFVGLILLIVLYWIIKRCIGKKNQRMEVAVDLRANSMVSTPVMREKFPDIMGPEIDAKLQFGTKALARPVL